jgi:hypothetical protein
MKCLPDWLRRRLGAGRPAPAGRLPVIQIEVTSRCQTQCVFCPRQALKDRWLHGDLAWCLPPWPQTRLPAVRRNCRWDAGRVTNSMAYDRHGEE